MKLQVVYNKLADHIYILSAFNILYKVWCKNFRNCCIMILCVPVYDIICYTDHMTSCGTMYCTDHVMSYHKKYHTVGIYYKSFNFVIFVILKILAKIKASAHFWIHIFSMYLLLWILYSKTVKLTFESKIMWFANISSHIKFPLYTI